MKTHITFDKGDVDAGMGGDHGFIGRYLVRRPALIGAQNIVQAKRLRCLRAPQIITCRRLYNAVMVATFQ